MFEEKKSCNTNFSGHAGRPAVTGWAREGISLVISHYLVHETVHAVDAIADIGSIMHYTVAVKHAYS